MLQQGFCSVQCVFSPFNPVLSCPVLQSDRYKAESRKIVTKVPITTIEAS